MLVDRVSPGKQQPREQRQVRAALRVDVPEARHDVQQQEQADHAADGDEEHRIDRGVDHALADRLELAGVRHVARECRREVAGLLARLHRGDVQRREGLRELLERRRERLAFPQHRDEPLYHAAPFAAALLLPERFDRLDERQPGVDQHAQLLAEERHREAPAASAPRRAERVLRAHAEHGVAAAFELADRRGFVRRLRVDRLDAAARSDRLELVAHR